MMTRSKMAFAHLPAGLVLGLALGLGGCSSDDPGDGTLGAACETTADCSPAEACIEAVCTALPDGAVPPVEPAPPVDKVDLLFVVDNSISMADKQGVLAASVPRLVERLMNPVCISDDGTSVTVASADAACPDGTRRQFAPVSDIHAGVISSSLGTEPENGCAPNGFSAERDEQVNDLGHLIGSRPRAADLALSAPYLAYDGLGDVAEFTDTLGALIERTGEQGCGFEAPLEAMYRFLIDPAPSESVVTVPCEPGGLGECAEPQGVDSALLSQRASFLRPDSMLAIVVVSDESDCSMDLLGTNFRIADLGAPLPRGSSACEADPNDPCCYSCGEDPPAGCSADPICTDDSGNIAILASTEDNVNLRCWQQKRRFGIELLYPTERYVNALTAPSLCTSRTDLDAGQCEPGALVPNPLFATAGVAPRRPAHVLFTAIAGVPWQDIRASVDESGAPHPAGELHFLSTSEIPWDDVLGSPAASPPAPPGDPLMRESVEPRSGTNPATNEALAPPGSPYLENPINGHERNIAEQNSLQYTCIFPLPETRDCAVIDEMRGCDCRPDLAADSDPLCQAPDGTYGTTQFFAKAFPGLRQLDVARRLGRQATIGSVCPRQLDAPQGQDYGYGPAFDALVDRAAEGLVR